MVEEFLSSQAFAGKALATQGVTREAVESSNDFSHSSGDFMVQLPFHRFNDERSARELYPRPGFHGFQCYPIASLTATITSISRNAFGGPE